MCGSRWLWFVLLLFLPLAAQAKKHPLSKQEKEWLRKVDVIITPEERREFKKRLQTSRDRKKFMQLFWAKRNPDPTSGRNTFRDEYLARFDFVMANFEPPSSRIPINDRSIIYLLLGKPTRVEHRVDITIMGARYRNPYFQHRPELWVYEGLGFDYKRKRLKIQFVPTTTFGDFVGLTDNFSSLWLKRLKYKLIFNPDLEIAPLAESDEEFFQDVEEAEIPQETAPASRIALAPEPEKDETLLDEADEELFEDEAEAAESPAPPAADNLLTVPSKPSTTAAPPAPFAYSAEAGNPMELTARLGYFKAGSDRDLLLGRIGFPLRALDFEFEKNQYRAPFVLHYSLVNSNNQTVFSDQLENQVLVPNRLAIEKKETLYDEELAVILPADRYTLKAQLQDLRKGTLSYLELPFEVAPRSEAIVTTTSMVLMDPNINPDEAKFSVREKPFALRLSDKYKLGERLFPVVEIINNPTQEELDGIRFTALREGGVEQTWNLYPEEMSRTNQNTVLVHPTLSTKNLSPGKYLLRFELELLSGDMVLAESEFEVIPP